MKKLYLILLMLLILFIPTTNAVAVYQLDQPIKELDNYTLKEVFENRNMAMPDLEGKEYLGDGEYKISEYRKYNIYSGLYSQIISSNSFRTFLIVDLEPGLYTVSYTRINGRPDAMRYFINNEYKNSISNIFQIEVDNKQSVQFSLYESINNGVEFKLQLEKGSQATPYQVPTNGPYSDIDVGEFNLISEQIQTYYDLYLEAVRFEQENIEASQDPGGYQNIFRSIINGVRGLVESMGDLWQWLNAPLITDDMNDYSFTIDWSWDLIGVIRQIFNGLAKFILQAMFIFPNILYNVIGIPGKVTILSLLFSNFVFVVLGWIMVKSFVI